MKLGVTVRNMGPESTRELLLYCARKAEAAGLDHIWALDHIAIPPEDSEGSDGRYLDPLAALAFLAAATERIGLGTSVLVLPYRPVVDLAAAMLVATGQRRMDDAARAALTRLFTAPMRSMSSIGRLARSRAEPRRLLSRGQR